MLSGVVLPILIGAVVIGAGAAPPPAQKIDLAPEQLDRPVKPAQPKAPEANKEGVPGTDYVPGELLVELKQGMRLDDGTVARVKEFAGVASMQSKLLFKKAAGSMGKRRIFVFRLKPGISVPDALRKLRLHGLVKRAEPNYIRRLRYVPNDPDFGKQWAYRNTGQTVKNAAGKAGADIDAAKGWDLEKGDSHPVTVAVIDSGIDPGHPDLKDKLWQNVDEVPGNGRDDDGNGYIDDRIGYNFSAQLPAEAEPRDEMGHGTHVAGIVGAATNNGTGVAGMSAGAKIMSLKFGQDISSSFFMEAVSYAVDNGAKVINMSFGGPNHSSFEADAVNYAHRKGVVLIASAGNSGALIIEYPVAYPHVIGVGATTNRDKLTGFSTAEKIVDVSAPGEDILSTTPTYPVRLTNEGMAPNYDYMDGTSMASPMVAGLAALVLARKPELRPEQVGQLIEEHAVELGVSGRDNLFGHGRINSYETLKHATILGDLSAVPNDPAGISPRD